jgi:hypothetical protein
MFKIIFKKLKSRKEYEWEIKDLEQELQKYKDKEMRNIYSNRIEMKVPCPLVKEIVNLLENTGKLHLCGYGGSKEVNYDNLEFKIKGIELVEFEEENKFSKFYREEKTN